MSGPQSISQFREFLATAKNGEIVVLNGHGEQLEAPSNVNRRNSLGAAWMLRRAAAVAAGLALLAAATHMFDSGALPTRTRLVASPEEFIAARAQLAVQRARLPSAQELRARDLRATFLRTTEANEGYGVTTVTPAGRTGRFLFRGRVERVEPSADGAILIGTTLRGAPARYHLRWEDLRSSRVLLTISGIQLDATASDGVSNGVTLQSYAQALGVQSATLMDFVSMAVDLPGDCDSAAYPGSPHDRVNRVFAHLYWSDDLTKIRSERTALVLADIGVNLGRSNRADMARQALRSCGDPIADAVDPIHSAQGVNAINAVDPVRFREALALAVGKHYVWLSLRDPARFADNLDGWINRAKSYSEIAANRLDAMRERAQDRLFAVAAAPGRALRMRGG